MKRYLPWAAGALVLWLLWWSHDRDVARHAVLVEQTRVAEARRDSALALLPPLEARAAHDSAEAVRVRLALDSAQRSFDRRIRQAQVREQVATTNLVRVSSSLDTTLADIRAAVPEPLVPLADSAIVQKARLVAEALAVQDAAHDQIRESLSLLNATREFATAETLRANSQADLVSGLRTALSAETARGDVWEARARKAESPGLAARLRRAVVPVAVGVGAVLLLRP